MKFRDLLLIVAIVVAVIATARSRDLYRATEPVSGRVAWWLAAPARERAFAREVEESRAAAAAAKAATVEAERKLRLAEAEAKEAEQTVEHLERVRQTQSAEIAHCQQLQAARESVLRDAERRYQELARKVRDIGNEAGLQFGIVKE